MSARFLWFPLVSVTKRFVAVNMCLGRFSESPLITVTLACPVGVRINRVPL